MRNTFLPHQPLKVFSPEPFCKARSFCKSLPFCKRNIAYGLTLFCFALGLYLAIALPADAQYQPPAGGSPPRSGTGSSTGTRGVCSGTGMTALTLLAPFNPIGQTVSTHPALSWFVPDVQSRPIELRLYQYGADNKLRLVQQAQLQSQPGMMSWSLPADQPGLSVNQQYYWQVSLTCNPNHPSEDLFAEAEFRVVSPSAELISALSSTPDRLKRADLYAKAGLWYDAFAEAIAAGTSQAKVYQLELLQSLADAERPDEPIRSHQLDQIVEAERL